MLALRSTASPLVYYGDLMARGKSEDVTEFTNMLVQEVRDGQETVQGLEELKETTARLVTAAGRDPEANSFYTAVTTAIYIVKQQS